MATVTGLTAARMLAIEQNSVVDGEVVGNNLILSKYNGSTIDAGNVRGTQGLPGSPGVGMNPVEIGADVDLDTLKTTGNHVQSNNAEATLLLNYPQPLAGLLEVINLGNHTWQRYTTYAAGSPANTTYTRALYFSTWTPWKEQEPRKWTQAVASSATLNLTATSTDIAGMSITVPVFGPSDVYMVTGALDMNSFGTTSTTGVGRLDVNGVIQSAQIIWANAAINGLRGTAYQQWVVTGLAAGNRIFKMVAHRSGGADLMVRINPQHSTMVVNQIS